MTKLEKIDQQEQKMREKIVEMQNQLKQIDGQRTEQENLQIIQQVRALKLSHEELYAFIHGRTIPAMLAGAIDNTVEPETIYSRRNKKRNALSDDSENTNFEREDIADEEQQ